MIGSPLVMSSGVALKSILLRRLEPVSSDTLQSQMSLNNFTFSSSKATICSSLLCSWSVEKEHILWAQTTLFYERIKITEKKRYIWSTFQLFDSDLLKSSVFFVLAGHTFIIIPLPGGNGESVKRDYQLSQTMTVYDLLVLLAINSTCCFREKHLPLHIFYHFFNEWVESDSKGKAKIIVFIIIDIIYIYY